MKHKITGHTVTTEKVYIVYITDDGKQASVTVKPSYKAQSVSEGDLIRIDGGVPYWTPMSKGKANPVGELALEMADSVVVTQSAVPAQ